MFTIIKLFLSVCLWKTQMGGPIHEITNSTFDVFELAATALIIFIFLYTRMVYLSLFLRISQI